LFFAFSRGRYALYRTGKFVCVLLADLALSITACAERLGCAPYGRHTFLACPRKVCQRRAPRHPGFATRNFSLRRCSGCRLTWAIPGPLSGAAIGISPHPCGSLPYATPPLGLLKGTRSRACVIFAELELAAPGLCLCSSTAMVQTTSKSPSGGRVESLWKGLSDMDVARAVMGQGWPFTACPWNGDGAREPRRSRGRMVGCPSLWLLSLGQARESDSPVGGETHQSRRRANG
jgi:hypothetical protein